MTDDTQQNEGVIIPDEAQEKFPELVEKILASVSMDTEERNYWLSVLTVMSDDQIAELEDILNSEQEKMSEISQKKEADLSPEDLEKIEEERRRKKAERLAEEQKHRAETEEKAEDLLDQLGNL